jgi:hypothetical protein
VIVVGILGAPGAAGERALEIARRAAATGARVEMVGVAAPDPTGDTRLLELAAASIGHATVIRSRADAIEPADLDLALRYLPDVRAVVLVAPDATLANPAAAAAGWTGASVVIVGPLDQVALDALDASPVRPMVLEPPASDPDDAFPGVVAALAVRLDAGDTPTDAWRATVATLAIDSVSEPA